LVHGIDEVAALKTFSPGLRTEILLSLTLILVAAMALTGFIVMRIMERDLLRHKAADGVAVVERLQALVEEITLQQGSVPVQLIKCCLAGPFRTI
jgi:hypothetical protein